MVTALLWVVPVEGILLLEGLDWPLGRNWPFGYDFLDLIPSFSPDLGDTDPPDG